MHYYEYHFSLQQGQKNFSADLRVKTFLGSLCKVIFVLEYHRMFTFFEILRVARFDVTTLVAILKIRKFSKVKKKFVGFVF